MIATRPNQDYVPQRERFRGQTARLPSLDDLPSELALLTVPPEVDVSRTGQGDDVVRSTDYLRDGLGGDVERDDGGEFDQRRSGTSVKSQ